MCNLEIYDATLYHLPTDMHCYMYFLHLQIFSFYIFLHHSNIPTHESHVGALKALVGMSVRGGNELNERHRHHHGHHFDDRRLHVCANLWAITYSMH